MIDSQIKKLIESAEIAGEKFFINVSSRFASSVTGRKYGQNTGNSLEYMDHREYQPGDDIRHIDWNALARSDKLTVKLFREETTPHVDIFLDGSRSMGVKGTEKAAGLWAIFSLLKTTAINSGFSVKPWMVKDFCRPIQPSNLPILLWPDKNLDFTGNPGKTLIDAPPTMKSKSIRFLISDLFWLAEPMKILQQLADQASILVIIQLVSRFDLNPELQGNIRLIDSETGNYIELVSNSESLRNYKDNFSRHQEYWKRCCTKFGAVYSLMVAEEFIKDFFPEDLLKSEVLTSWS